MALYDDIKSSLETNWTATPTIVVINGDNDVPENYDNSAAVTVGGRGIHYYSTMGSHTNLCTDGTVVKKNVFSIDINCENKTILDAWLTEITRIINLKANKYWNTIGAEPDYGDNIKRGLVMGQEIKLGV